jgi:uncharacterized membrane protein (UPF0127 family)
MRSIFSASAAMERADRFVVHNRTRGAIVAVSVGVADTPKSRRIGLLRHKSLEPGEGLWLYPTQAIHTFGMQFPIDVAFLDRGLRVKRVYHRLRPFRLTSFVWGARSVLELPSGSLAGTGTVVGDELQFSPCKDPQ